MREDLNRLLERIARETGDVCSLRPPPSTDLLSDLPLPLRSFYGLANGIELPFLTLPPAELLAAMQESTPDPAWVLFGQDFYFSFYLCAKTPAADGMSITSWDHESDTDIEPAYVTVLELLASEYEEYITSKLGVSGAVFSIAAVPPSLSLAKLMGSLKTLTTLGSADLLGKLRALPMSFPVTDTAAAVTVLRSFHDLGVSCTLRPSAV